MHDHFDVVIVGAGMVGASLACSLLTCMPALKLAVVEAFPLKTPDAALSSYDARSTALSWGSSRLFEKIGLWSSIAPHATAINKIQVSDQGFPIAARLDRDRLNLAALGYVVENRKLGIALLEYITRSDQIELLAPATVTDFRPTRSGSLVRLHQENAEREISTQLVVVADGSESGLRQKIGIHTDVEECKHAALIANVSVDRPHSNMAFERFTESGPIALLPLAAYAEDLHRYALVFHLHRTECDRLLKVGDEEFISQLHSRFGYRAGRILKVGERNKHELIQARAREQIRQGCVILGNAAHTLHPVAAQGFNLSLRDARCLTSVLFRAHENGDDLGSLALLDQYMDLQRQDQVRVHQFTHFVLELFTMKQLVPRLVRQLGLLSLDFLPAVKSEFIAFTAGLRSDL
ncbi:MAG: FAD-dependent monooxygenase [Gammaproteobacteria bacterium]|nr:FAD-dependent monooxygenase [Gammaproteobacteria bacterium]